ncbi:MerR family transcriptional regulator [Salimicrobium halophilum]|uniref:DNA-binding transcriptional regulator, MerR family n=1 Tax=Salimicrobium halophilum TaxID=86666 RepID=A0A1G8UF09_9BACI|nr:MerR family transcriptional regulator [Salimicrobium halophilum]SDJ51600.1 DNA-binding transcriptional regulator, MerR family [Salimicrobium halophilum]
MYWTTGEVAEKLGISVRTIRYYDQIELLTPEKKSSSGKRLYSEDDVEKLTRITWLKSLALPLSKIADIIDQMTVDHLLTLHYRMLKEEQQKMTQSMEQTQRLLQLHKLHGKIDWKEINALIQSFEDRDHEDVWQEFFSGDEGERLAAGVPKMEEEQTMIWGNVIKRIELCIAKGIQPSDQEAQLIASDVQLLSKQMFGGDEELAAKFWEVRKSEESSEQAGLYPVSQEVLQFLEEAFKVSGEPT